MRVIVEGRVQGVWFRAHTEKKAKQLGVLGFVRNRADGTVEIVAEGKPDAVDRLVEWAWTGSPHSSVTAVDVSEIPASGFELFETRY